MRLLSLILEAKRYFSGISSSPVEVNFFFKLEFIPLISLEKPLVKEYQLLTVFFWRVARVWANWTINPWLLTSDQHLISPYSNTAKLVIKIIRIKEMIAILRSFDYYTNSLCYYQKKFIDKGLENMDTDVRV